MLVAIDIGNTNITIGIFDKDELIGEISDLFYHVFVLMNNQGVSLDDVENKLKERHKITGNKKEFHTRGEY